MTGRRGNLSIGTSLAPIAVVKHRLWERGSLVLSTLACTVVLLVCVRGTCVGGTEAAATEDVAIPVLVYHRFGPVVRDSMTVTTKVFARQLQYLAANGYSVIAARQYVAYRLGKAPPPPRRAVIITADDGHRSVYTDMLPLVMQHRIPVTLFIYPSAISNADYALTWEQLRELQRTGFFDIQSHTYWHPNFKQEKRRLSAHEYERFVALQLTKARDTIHHELGVSTDLLAWPFGIFDPDLIKQAESAGYVAGFTLQRRPAGRSDQLLALPRYLVTNSDTGKAFESLLSAGMRSVP